MGYLSLLVALVATLATVGGQWNKEWENRQQRYDQQRQPYAQLQPNNIQYNNDRRIYWHRIVPQQRLLVGEKPADWLRSRRYEVIHSNNERLNRPQAKPERPSPPRKENVVPTMWEQDRLRATIGKNRTSQKPRTKLTRDFYCSISTCPDPQTHTMCRYPPRQTSPMCGKIESTNMTIAEIKEVLDKHNELRAKVARGEEHRGSPGPQPAAKNIGPLKWNKHLAKIAQTWANQCLFKHDICRNVKKKTVGQNIGYYSWSSSYRTILSDIVTAWYDEVENFDSRDVNNYRGKSSRPNKMIGHYAQLVWAKTTEIGCGLIRFNDPVTTRGMYRTQLVCNYAQAGNYIGQPVYETF